MDASKIQSGASAGIDEASAAMQTQDNNRRTFVQADSPAARKAANLTSKIASLEAQIADTQSKLAEVEAQLKNPAAETVRAHIKLLHDYNEIRDVGLGLIGMIAEQRGLRMKDVLGEFGVGEGD
ncbi:hypothetical protein MMC25_003822 [Agyrium rufum]|nr:hypothetical protein [Agyrium rufum]